MKIMMKKILWSLIVSGSLSFAEASMLWHIEHVDEGYWNSIVLDNNGVPHISYYYQDLKYAVKIGGNWTFEIVDSIGNVGDYNSLKLDKEGNPHISYYDATNGDLKYAKKDSVWVIEKVDTTGNVGLYSSLFLDSLDHPCIAYCDFTQKALKYAKKIGENWQIQIVDTSQSEISYASLVLDSYDNPHIAYIFCGGYLALKYAHFNGIDWQIEIADSDHYPPPYDMGYVTLVLDSSNTPYISYSGIEDVGWGVLRCVVEDSSGWECLLERGSLTDEFFPNSITLSCINDTTIFHVIYSGTYHLGGPSDHTTYITKEINPPRSWEECYIDSTHMYWIHPRCLVIDSINRPHFSFEGVYYGYGELVGVEERAFDFKGEHKVERIYPNPFRQSTVIRYWLPTKSEISLKIYDLTGRLVKILVAEEVKAGYHAIIWNGEDEKGKKVKKGIYFCRLEVDTVSPQTKKIVYLR